MVHQVFYYTTILNFPGVVREANLWTFEPTIWWNSHQQSAVSGLTKATCLCTVTTSLEIIITTINYWFSVLVNLCFVLSSCLFTLFNLSGTELIINKTVKRWQWDETSTLDIVVNKRKWLSNELSCVTRAVYNRQFRNTFKYFEYLAPRFGSPNVRKWGILGFGIRNTALGIRNPTNDWNPESKFHWQRLESSTCNPESTALGIQNPRLSWIWKCPISHIVYRSLSLIAAFTGQLKLFWDIYKKIIK